MNDITKYIFKGIKTDDGKKALSMYEKKTRKTEQFGVNDGEKPPKKRQQRKDPFKWITLYFFTKPTSMWEDERFCCCSSDLYALWAEHLIPIQAKVTFVHSHYIYPTCDVRESHRTQFEDDTWERKKGSTFGVSRLLSERQNQMLRRKKDC